MAKVARVLLASGVGWRRGGGTVEQAEDFAFVLSQVHPDRRPDVWEIFVLLAITMSRNLSTEVVVERIFGEERRE